MITPKPIANNDPWQWKDRHKFEIQESDMARFDIQGYPRGYLKEDKWKPAKK